MWITCASVKSSEYSELLLQQMWSFLWHREALALLCGTVLDSDHQMAFHKGSWVGVARWAWRSHLLALGNPSCSQATVASTSLHELTHTLAQTLPRQTSTSPPVATPPRSLMSPRVQDTAQLTPASSKCKQVLSPSGLAWQSSSLVSFPRHWTSANQIRPDPSGTRSIVRSIAPI